MDNLIRCFVAAVFLGSPLLVQAQTATWDWTMSSTEVQASGTFTTSTTLQTGQFFGDDPVGSIDSSTGYLVIDGYLVTGISGIDTVASGGPSYQNPGVFAINSLSAPNEGFFYSDNILAANTPQISLGILFTDSGSNEVRLWFDSNPDDGASYNQYNYSIANGDGGGGGIMTFSAFEVPEPSQYGFLVVLAAAGFIGWRRLCARTI